LIVKASLPALGIIWGLLCLGGEPVRSIPAADLRAPAVDHGAPDITVVRSLQENPAAFVQITSGPAIDYFPSWSPDGSSIAFGSNRQADNIWIVSAAGGEPTQATRDPEGNPSRHPSWSPNGNFIAHDAASGTRVHVISTRDGSVVAAIPDFVPISRGGYPCWSPDGSKIAFTAEGGIWTIESSSDTLTQVYSREGRWVRAFGWSPDGSHIAVDVATLAMRERDIWIVPVDGSPAVQLTDNPGEDANPHWSPDGSTIAFMSDRGGNWDIWVIPAEGGTARQVTFHPSTDRNPRWSPDGTRLAFASDRDGSLDIWTLDMKLQLGTPPELMPARHDQDHRHQ
jgi:TolB protein